MPVEVVPYDPGWPHLFEAESERVRRALGRLVDGGALEDLEHLGSTSVPGLVAKPTIDMMGRIHPYPPSPASVAALAAIGYTWRGEYGLPGRTYFTKGPHDFHLHLIDMASEHWERHIVFRDYLRAHRHAQERYATLKLDLAELFRFDRPAYQDGKTDLIRELSQEASAWQLQATGFSPIERVASWFEGVPDDGTWAVASGWALDLHTGAPSRYHDDVDVEVTGDRQTLVQRHLLESGWRLDQVIEGCRYLPWSDGEPLAPGTHQAHARRDGQFLDLLFAPRGEDTWRFRRDERVTLPLKRALLNATLPSGRPVKYLAPEVVLLFKSRSSQTGQEAGPRAKDANDFARVAPSLGAEAREWLQNALRTVHGEHPWLAELTGDGSGR